MKVLLTGLLFTIVVAIGWDVFFHPVQAQAERVYLVPPAITKVQEFWPPCCNEARIFIYNVNDQCVAVAVMSDNIAMTPVRCPWDKK